jgi:hypothetical protein
MHFRIELARHRAKSEESCLSPNVAPVSGGPAVRHRHVRFRASVAHSVSEFLHVDQPSHHSLKSLLVEILRQPAVGDLLLDESALQRRIAPCSPRGASVLDRLYLQRYNPSSGLRTPWPPRLST